jgi:carboxyl-terminal processing protease
MKLLKLLQVLLLAFISVSFAVSDLWDTPVGRERIFRTLVETFRQNYWDADYLDWDSWADSYRDQALSAASRQQFDTVLRQMVREIDDDHSRWVGITAPSSPLLEPEMVSEPALGIQQGFLPGTVLVIERVFPETPAYAAGLRRGDVITRINGDDIRQVSRVETNSVLSAAIASGTVNLGVRRKLSLETFLVTPEPLLLAQVRDRPQAEMLDDLTGYLFIPTFQGDDIARDVHRLIRSLQTQGATSLVLDLRDNLGGRLGELGLILGAFIEGEWAEAVSRNEVVWRSRYYLEANRGINVLQTPSGSAFAGDTLTEPAFFTGPLAVIVSRHNSSAGEIAALVLQERGRATIVGEETTGNVEAVQGFTMPDGSLVLVAVANLQGISWLDFSAGIVPDVTASSSLHDLARGFDPPVAEALRALKALPFTPGKFF